MSLKKFISRVNPVILYYHNKNGAFFVEEIIERVLIYGECGRCVMGVAIEMDADRNTPSGASVYRVVNLFKKKKKKRVNVKATKKLQQAKITKLEYWRLLHLIFSYNAPFLSYKTVSR